MIYTKQIYVSGSMCDLGIDGIVAKAKYNAMWLIVKNNIRFLRRPVWREAFSVSCYISKHSSVKLNIEYVKFVLNDYSADNEERVLALRVDRFIDYKKEDYAEILSDVDCVLDTIGERELAKELSVLK